MSYRGFIAALPFLALAVGGCFFVQGINGEPRARIEKNSQGPHFRGDTLSFSAIKSSDPDGEVLRAEWKAFTCSPDGNACDAPAFASKAAAHVSERFAITIPAFRQDSTGAAGEATTLILVRVTVFDSHGATHEDQLHVDVLNQNPALDLQVQGFRSPSGSGYPIGTTMKILAEASDPDGDAVSLDWRLYPAEGSTPGDVGWQAVDDSSYQLSPDITGLWRVEVTASDSVGGTVTGSESILIQDDALPCVAATEPEAVPDARYILDRDALPRRFAVLQVRDDLDVYPPPPASLQPPMGTAGFRWFVATPDTSGALVQIEGHDSADLVVDTSAYAPGDRLELRVEIDDRVGRDVICAPDAPTCSLGGDSCRQRVTWEVEVR